MSVNQPSLKLFYNYGRLTMKLHCGMRVSWTELDHDRDWIRVEDGYHCKVCGDKLTGNRRLFCSTKCEDFFESNYRQIRTWEAFRRRVFDRDNGKCQICGKTIAVLNEQGYWTGTGKDDFQFICDHIIALCNGGRDWWEDPGMFNFQTLCVDCNKQKTHRDIKVLYAEKKLVSVIGNSGSTLEVFIK